ncbi:MAG: hypothetical protein E7G05_17445, partial [Pseudomonas aeruginosa]|nr:hypothetical protein [Pseudomonas aeruginosa]
SASAKVICFIRKLGGWRSAILPKSESLFQTVPRVSPEPTCTVIVPIDLPIGACFKVKTDWRLCIGRGVLVGSSGLPQ